MRPVALRRAARDPNANPLPTPRDRDALFSGSLDRVHRRGAAADIADNDEIIVIGSQSVLAQFPQTPEALLISVEADLFPKNKPARWDLIDGTIGEGSPFHSTFGYYAQGADEATAVLPAGWKTRLVPIRNDNTRGATGWCPEVHDRAIAWRAVRRICASSARPSDRVYCRSQGCWSALAKRRSSKRSASG